MPEDPKPHGSHRNNVIPFPRARRHRMEIWRVIYVGQSNDGWIKRTLILRD